MARGFVGTADCEVLYEDFMDLAEGSVLTGCITQASDWVYSVLSEMQRTPSSALPATGTSPNFWVRLATASESIYLAVKRRMEADKETGEGYWRPFHDDAMGILEDFRTGVKRLDPEPKIGERGIGPCEAVANGTLSPQSFWVESNTLVPGSYYQDDWYARTYTVELQTVGATLSASTFRWRSNENDVGVWEESNRPCSWSFTCLSNGVEVRFFPEYLGSMVVGQSWTIRCFPERDRKSRANGGETVLMERA